jgi:hypothetical protein
MATTGTSGSAGAADGHAAEKLDLIRIHKEEYARSKKPMLLTIGPARYLTITGRGEPGGEVFQQQLGALYGMAFTIKMARKFSGIDYAVAPLEGLWWGRRKVGNFMDDPRASWNWKLLIRTPDFITDQDVRDAVDHMLAKGTDRSAAKVKLETIEEGLCVQAMHVGPYATEPATIDAMRVFAREQGVKIAGIHHEIYFSDPRRTAPEKMKTIIRYPVK